MSRCMSQFSDKKLNLSNQKCIPSYLRKKEREK